MHDIYSVQITNHVWLAQGFHKVRYEYSIFRGLKVGVFGRGVVFWGVK